MLLPDRVLASPVRLELPGDHDCVAIARMFSSAAARHFDLSQECIEDVKIAISEAVTSAIDPYAPHRIGVTVEADSERVRFSVLAPLTDRLDSNAIALAVIASLFEDAGVHHSEQSSSITFSIPLEQKH
ncbi:MAG: ATP-binding protein [Actinomycetota bacterium]